jgi:hypothetical protein
MIGDQITKNKALIKNSLFSNHSESKEFIHQIREDILITFTNNRNELLVLPITIETVMNNSINIRHFNIFWQGNQKLLTLTFTIENHTFNEDDLGKSEDNSSKPQFQMRQDHEHEQTNEELNKPIDLIP